MVNERADSGRQAPPSGKYQMDDSTVSSPIGQDMNELTIVQCLPAEMIR